MSVGKGKKREFGAADKAMRIFGPKDKTTRERKDRQHFQIFMSRVFAPFAHFKRGKENGAYLSHSVDVAWRVWGEAQYSPYRPLVDGSGKPIEAPQQSRRA